MSMYWSKLSSTALVCIVDLSCIVDLKCACWNIAYAEELLPISYVSLGMYRKRRNYCRGVISVQENLPHSLWVSLDLHDILAIIWTPAYPVVSICLCWPPKRRVYNITSLLLQHRKHLLLLCCLHYLPIQGVTILSANVGRHSLCVHCQGYHSEYP